MQRYPWPGNVRELANIVERLSIMQPGADVTGSRVRDVLRPAETGRDAAVSRAWGEPGTAATPPSGDSLAKTLDDYERRMIVAAIDAAKGNIAEAARRLQTDRPNLYRRMKRLGIGDSAEADNREKV
jgi:DNA-binding NtrC family response regulator